MNSLSRLIYSIQYSLYRIDKTDITYNQLNAIHSQNNDNKWLYSIIYAGCIILYFKISSGILGGVGISLDWFNVEQSFIQIILLGIIVYESYIMTIIYET